MTDDAAFVIPGDIGLPTGGYTYDRRVLALLPEAGLRVCHVSLGATYPLPTDAELASTERTLAALPPDLPLLIDGLALGAMPVDLLRRLRQPVVALCHHPLALEAGLDATRQTSLRASETAALAHARHVVATSPTTKRTLVAEFGMTEAGVTVAEPGTDPAARAVGSAGATASAGTVAMLAVGSIVPRKGYDVLVRALQRLPAGLDWTVTVAGASDRAPETTRNLLDQIATSGLAGRIRLIGPVGDTDLERLYHRADLFVMPSLYEGYGMVLAEAMARGLPIVCTTGGAAAETVPDAAAIKVAPGDDRAFAAALATALAGPRDAMSEASWAAGQKLPSWRDTAGIIADVMRKIRA